MKSMFAVPLLIAGAAAAQWEQQYRQPSYNYDQRNYGNYGGYGGYGNQYTNKYEPKPTYVQDHAHGYSIRPVSYAEKPKIGNDGYKVKQRSDPYSAPRKPIYAKCALKDPNEETMAGGVINFFYAGQGSKTTISGEIWDISPGFHGFHVHALGDLTDGCASLGGHFNPEGTDHGSFHDHADHRHVGDLEQVEANQYGYAQVYMEDMLVDLWGNHSIIGRSLVLHAGPDDLGRGDDASSRANGNSGPRIACCTIGLSAAPKPTYNHHGHDYGYQNQGYPEQAYSGHNNYQKQGNYHW